jgi:hypothetical protein
MTWYQNGSISPSLAYALLCLLLLACCFVIFESALYGWKMRKRKRQQVLPVSRGDVTPFSGSMAPAARRGHKRAHI